MRSRKKQPTIRRDAKPVFSLGNYDVNYAKRNDRFAELDPRLLALHEFQKSARGQKFPPFFDGKDVLDIGCNQGVVTLSVGAFLRARRVVGTDIDLNVIKNALAQLRMTKEHGIHITNEMQSSNPCSFVKQRGIPFIFSKPWRLIRDIEYDPSAYDFPYNIEFRAEDILASPIEYLRGTFFDTILLFDVTQFVHMNNGDQGVQELLRRCYDFLRPGGVLLLERTSTPYQKKRKHATQAMRETILPALEFRPDDFSAYLYQLGFQKKTEVMSPKQYDLQHMIFIFRKPLNAVQLVGQDTHLGPAMTARSAGGNKFNDARPRSKTPSRNGAESSTPQQRERTESASPRNVSKRPRLDDDGACPARKAALLSALHPSPSPSVSSSSFAVAPGSSPAVADPSLSTSCPTPTVTQASPRPPVPSPSASLNSSPSASPILSPSASQGPSSSASHGASPYPSPGGFDLSPRASFQASLNASHQPQLDTPSGPASSCSSQSASKSPLYSPTGMASSRSNQSASKSSRYSPTGPASIASRREHSCGEASDAEPLSGLGNHAVISEQNTLEEHRQDKSQEEHPPLARAPDVEPSSGLGVHAVVSEQDTTDEHRQDKSQEQPTVPAVIRNAEPLIESGIHAIVSEQDTPEEHRKDKSQEQQTVPAVIGNAEPLIESGIHAVVSEQDTTEEHRKDKPQEQQTVPAVVPDTKPLIESGIHAVVSEQDTPEEHRTDKPQEQQTVPAVVPDTKPLIESGIRAAASEEDKSEVHRESKSQEYQTPLAGKSDADPSSGLGIHDLRSEKDTHENHQKDKPQEHQAPLSETGCDTVTMALPDKRLTSRKTPLK